MRIIAGEKRSRKLLTLDGLDTRPTLDRVKEALFSILGSRIPGARVLDLYAGSGALALEALSRGAESAVLCDVSRKACQVISANIAALDYGGKARLLCMPDTAALALLQREGAAFDLIFLDPPYRMETAGVCGRILEAGLLKPEGIIILEHAGEKEPLQVPGLTLFDRRRYGIAGLAFYCRSGEECT